ncbi:hypothetical protein CSUI_006146, partial [Cystoisospora suis]
EEGGGEARREEEDSQRHSHLPSSSTSHSHGGDVGQKLCIPPSDLPPQDFADPRLLSLLSRQKKSRHPEEREEEDEMHRMMMMLMNFDHLKRRSSLESTGEGGMKSREQGG